MCFGDNPIAGSDVNGDETTGGGPVDDTKKIVDEEFEQLPEVVVTAKREPAIAHGLQKMIQDIGAFFGSIPTMKFPGGLNPTLLQPIPMQPLTIPTDAITPYVAQAYSYSIGFANSVIMDAIPFSFIIPDNTEQLTADLPDGEAAYAGKLQGHYVSLVFGMVESKLGIDAGGGGIVLAPVTEGVSLTLVVPGALAAAHGISTVTNAEMGLARMAKVDLEGKKSNGSKGGQIT
jgi:hypothetical protein